MVLDTLSAYFPKQEFGPVVQELDLFTFTPKLNAPNHTMPPFNSPEKQTLLESLARGRSKKHIDDIVQWVRQSPGRLDALMEIFLGDQPRMAECAAWVVGTLGQKQPQLFLPWFPDMVAVLHEPHVHGSLKRNILRVLEQTTIPDHLLDSCTDACFKLLADPQEEIAIRAFAMGVLADICVKVPELWPELKLLLEDGLPHGTSAYKNRANKILKRFK